MYFPITMVAGQSIHTNPDVTAAIGAKTGADSAIGSAQISATATAGASGATATTMGATQQSTTKNTTWLQSKIQKITEFIDKNRKWIQERIERNMWWMTKFAKGAWMFAQFMKFMFMLFPIIIVFRMIIGLFTKPMEFIMMGISCLVLAVAYVIYYIFYIPPFSIVPFLLYFIVVDLVPAIAYTIVFGALFVAITIFCIIMTGINSLLGGALSTLVLCQNSPAAWYKTPNYHMGNKYERGMLCNKQCLPGFYPDPTGMYCLSTPKLTPSYCPQAEAMRLYTVNKNDYIYHYGDYPTIGNMKYMSKSPEERELLLKDHYLRKKDFLGRCEKPMSKFNYMSLNVCSSIDTMKQNNVNDDTILKMKRVCSQAYCNSKTNYPFCADISSTGAEKDSNEFWKHVIKILIMITCIIFIFMFTFSYMTKNKPGSESSE